MDLDNVLLGVVLTISVSVALTLTTSGVSATEFWFARLCYIVAALCILLVYGRWRFRGIQNSKVTNAHRATIGVLVLLASVGGLAIGVTWVGWRESSAAAQAHSQSLLTAQAHRRNWVVLQLSKFHNDAMDLTLAQVERDQTPLWDKKREELASNATTWVEKNLGVKAKNNLLDMSGFTTSDYAHVAEPERRDQLIWLDKFARNIRALMQEEVTAAATSR